MFTKKIAPGLSLAEDPGSGASFGKTRSELVARALWESYLNGISKSEDRAMFANEYFQSKGVDLQTMFLFNSSSDVYALRV
jgi:hypothetical protein